MLVVSNLQLRFMLDISYKFVVGIDIPRLNVVRPEICMSTRVGSISLVDTYICICICKCFPVRQSSESQASKLFKECLDFVRIPDLLLSNISVY